MSSKQLKTIFSIKISWQLMSSNWRRTVSNSTYANEVRLMGIWTTEDILTLIIEVSKASKLSWCFSKLRWEANLFNCLVMFSYVGPLLESSWKEALFQTIIIQSEEGLIMVQLWKQFLRKLIEIFGRAFLWRNSRNFLEKSVHCMRSVV